MNFENYIEKIQCISKILENATCAEDVLNNKNIDIKEDFQIVVLSSASNYDVVNDVIARLSQNGNREIVESNIKIISMSAWKDIFNKNEAAKEIFINNFGTIYANTHLLTYREVEKFLENEDTKNLIYSRIDAVIRKLCTYDRASLIALLNSKENGVETIKENLPNFFKKGEFDISTTYSKILYELDKVAEISKIEILRACNKNLNIMLSRETAIDNETDKLLNWIYDAFEETKMEDEERANIKKNIDKAVLENFNQILDKNNYDKNTIKILKQFDCTKEKFENNQNLFIDKAKEPVLIQYNYQPEEQNVHLNNTVAIKKINEILENTQNEITKENENLKAMIADVEQAKEQEQIGQNKQTAIEKIEEPSIEEQAVEIGKEEPMTEVISETEEKKAVYISSQDFINSYISKYNERCNAGEKQMTAEEMDEKLKKLIISNVEETNRIIEKVLHKNVVEKEEPKMEVQQNEIEINNIQNSIEKVQQNNKEQSTEELQQHTEMALAITDSDLEELFYEENIFKRIWNKIKKIFGIKTFLERLGE